MLAETGGWGGLSQASSGFYQSEILKWWFRKAIRLVHRHSQEWSVLQKQVQTARDREQVMWSPLVFGLCLNSQDG